MNLLQKLRDRLLSKKQDAITTYWAALTKAASRETLSERAMDALLASLDGVLPVLGKSADDVQSDLDLAAQFAAMQDAPAALDAARIEVRKLLAEAAQMSRRADELQAEVTRLGQTAQATRSKANAVQQSAEKRMAEFGTLRARLAAAGHPDHVAHASANARQREIESLRGELVSLDAGMNMSPESPNGRRNTIRARLAELGVPLEQDAAEVTP